MDSESGSWEWEGGSASSDDIPWQAAVVTAAGGSSRYGVIDVGSSGIRQHDYSHPNTWALCEYPAGTVTTDPIQCDPCQLLAPLSALSFCDSIDGKWSTTTNSCFKYYTGTGQQKNWEDSHAACVNYATSSTYPIRGRLAHIDSSAVWDLVTDWDQQTERVWIGMRLRLEGSFGKIKVKVIIPSFYGQHFTSVTETRYCVGENMWKPKP